LVCQIKQWRKGEQNERLFYKRFLESLPKKYPALIKHVAKSSPEMDKHCGVDFSIWFETEEDGRVKLKQFDFNIKSSDSFLDKHYSKYPKVGTFIFNKNDLKNRQALEEEFLEYVYSSEHLHTTLYW
jgi:hypothetical protein